MQNPRWQRLALLSMASLACILAGCTEHSSPGVAQSTDPNSQRPTMDWEMQWAQAALERNPNLEILTADREQRVFTVRDRHTTMTAEVQLGQIAAAPLEFLSQPSSTPSSSPDSTPGEAPKPAATAPLEPKVVTRLAEADEVAPVPAPVAPKSPSYTIDRSGGRTRVTGDGISVVYGDLPSPQVASSPSSERTRQYGSERSRALVRIEVPGASIAPSDELESAAITDGTVELEPVICEGPRVLQLDSRTFKVAGDALIARGGCELYITNSTVIASGTGVVIGDAIVHINNSRIEGGLASFEAKEQAKVFLRGSTLNGLPRRNRQALIQDQGGNSYQ